MFKKPTNEKDKHDEMIKRIDDILESIELLKSVNKVLMDSDVDDELKERTEIDNETIDSVEQVLKDIKKLEEEM